MIPQSRPSRQPLRAAWTLERLLHERSIALGHALAPSTHGTYSSALNSYLNFCKLHNLPVSPTPDTLSFFAVWTSHHISPRSVNNYLTGIANELEPYFDSVRSARNSPLVRRTIAGCIRLRGQPVRRKDALTLDDLARVYDTLGESPAHDDRLFVTQLLIGFFALMRLGELVQPDNERLRNSAHVTHRHTVSCETGRLSFTLPGSKTDRFFEGSTVMVKACTAPVDPVACFQQYLVSRDASFGLRHELWIRESGETPTRGWFIRRLRRFFPSRISGHSMRAGGATALAEAGTAPALIQAMGRWSSDTWQSYIRKHPVLLQGLLFDRNSLEH